MANNETSYNMNGIEIITILYISKFFYKSGPIYSSLVIFKCTFRVLNLPRKYCIMVLLWFELFLPKILMLKSYPLITQNLPLFGKSVIAVVIG